MVFTDDANAFIYNYFYAYV